MSRRQRLMNPRPLPPPPGRWLRGPAARAIAFLVVLLATGCRSPGPSSPSTGAARAASARPATFKLAADRWWPLNLPAGQRFDASALLRLPTGELLTVNDRGPTLYRIVLDADADSADLVPWPGAFTSEQLAPFAGEKHGRYDAEGLARDEAGRIYLCEEGDRWILRCDPVADGVERLAIDWNPVRHRFHPSDRNASFEGVAAGGGRLYVANERQEASIMVVDLGTLKVVGELRPCPAGRRVSALHYSDLCYYGDALFVLVRSERMILQVETGTGRVLAEYTYAAVERRGDAAYWPTFATGMMEGLAVDRDHFWLVTDNSGYSRVRRPGDRRPTLFRCPGNRSK